MADAAELSLTVARVVCGAFFLYLGAGLVFALRLYLGGGLERLDPAAARGSRPFKLLILPGVVALWPLLLGRRAEKEEGR